MGLWGPFSFKPSQLQTQIFRSKLQPSTFQVRSVGRRMWDFCHLRLELQHKTVPSGKCCLTLQRPLSCYINASLGCLYWRRWYCFSSAFLCVPPDHTWYQGVIRGLMKVRCDHPNTQQAVKTDTALQKLLHDTISGKIVTNIYLPQIRSQWQIKVYMSPKSNLANQCFIGVTYKNKDKE